MAGPKTRLGTALDVKNFGALWLVACFALLVLCAGYGVEGIIDGSIFVPARRGGVLVERASHPAGFYGVLGVVVLGAGVLLLRFAMTIRDFLRLAPVEVSPLHVLALASLVLLCGGYGLEGLLDGTIWVPLGGDSDLRLVDRFNPGGFYGALAGLAVLTSVFLIFLIALVRNFVSGEREYWRSRRP